MKKTIATLLGILVTTNTFADTGCMALAKTTWRGQVIVLPKQTIKINKITITSVVSQGGMFFKLIGAINGKPLKDSFFGCTENQPGKISAITLESGATSLTSGSVTPSNNPTKLSKLFGQWEGKFIETTTAPAKNFLEKV